MPAQTRSIAQFKAIRLKAATGDLWDGDCRLVPRTAFDRFYSGEDGGDGAWMEKRVQDQIIRDCYAEIRKERLDGCDCNPQAEMCLWLLEKCNVHDLMQLAEHGDDCNTSEQLAEKVYNSQSYLMRAFIEGDWNPEVLGYPTGGFSDGRVVGTPDSPYIESA